MTKTKIKYPKEITAKMIAPCGMNCTLCIGSLREKNRCPGCQNDDNDSVKAQSRMSCKIKTCENLKLYKRNIYCYRCVSFPCKRIVHLDKRYRTKYGMSMIDNLKQIQESGIMNFINSEKQKWKCQGCGGILSVHRESCLFCGQYCCCNSGNQADYVKLKGTSELATLSVEARLL